MEAVSKIQRHSWVPPKPAAEFLHTGRVRCISYYMHNIPYQIVFHHLMLTCHIFNHTKLYHIRLSSYHYHHIFRSYDMISLFISYHTIHDISFSPLYDLPCYRSPPALRTCSLCSQASMSMSSSRSLSSAEDSDSAVVVSR